MPAPFRVEKHESMCPSLKNSILLPTDSP
jgi:hypothetical protein